MKKKKIGWKNETKNGMKILFLFLYVSSVYL